MATGTASADPSAPRVPPVEEAARRLLDRVGRVSVTAVLLVLAVRFLRPAWWDGHALAVFVVGLAAGIPHGAVDHLVPAWCRARGAGRHHGPLLLLGYVCAAAAAFALALWLPAPALCAFLALSVVHFGRGETCVNALRAGAVPPPAGALCTVAYGAVVTVLPLVRHPDAVRAFLHALAPGTTWLLSSPARLAATVLIATATTAACVLLLRRRHRRDAAELLLLATLFWLVTPWVAFAVYFAAWHSPRHIARLVLADPANRPALLAGRFGRPLRRFCRQGALPTAVVLVAVAATAHLAGPHRQALATAGVAVLAALTLPHLLVVALLDRHDAYGPSSAVRAATRTRPARTPAPPA
ncbi:Brp/Blh family beta-carotene 15,15'-dioxygenase [Streptomyces sp. Tu 3180]|uniref:Brp/Blh family beta-carotene 15,15'-dioxygenase n=1 Tax=Streptomyces sp. Tu 3180 TaxID=2682611 RepID=UPI00135694E0|nr:Brp/Blh family beta-carotene 15,15'-dioxygenase [Streptomyces sp. Tu 3180]KAF3469253.1 beta-carotene 15,15'-dioxygenase, Brp/Blh family [Streptomyces sp. Tu 3180]